MSPESTSDQAGQLLLQFECRTLYAAQRINLTLRQVISRIEVPIPEYDFDALVAMLKDSLVKLTIHDLESAATQFAPHMPDDPHLKAGLAHLLAEKYTFARRDTRHLQQALGLDQPEVQAAYEARFGVPIENLFTAQSPPDQRPFWLRFSGEILQRIMPDFAREVDWLFIPSGQVIIRQGELGQSAYAIINGRVRIVATNSQGEEVVRIERGRGAIFGEIAMLAEGYRRTATVYALRDTELVRLSGESYTRLALNHPEFGLAVTRLINASFLESVSRQYQSSRLTTLAVLPAQSGVPVALFIERLAAAFSPFGSVMVLNSQRFDQMLGEGASQLPIDDPRQGQVVALLNQIETAHRFVILETDGSFTQWTGRCLRTADRVLVLADMGDQPDLSPIERDMEAFFDTRVAVNRELVLIVRDRQQQPEHTLRWLEKRRLLAHHHLNLDTPQDFAHLGRRFAGRAIGLALSGGGARGLAHIGVIRALQENQIPVDAVAGTSFGSIIGAMFSLERDWQHMVEDFEEFVRNRRKYFRPAIPFISILEGHRLSRLFQDNYDGIRIEDLWRPFFCVATNLTHSRLEILDQGPLWSGVRASMSIPTVFPPVQREGEILVDGGLINNLPSDLLKSRIEGGQVIGSDASDGDTEFFHFQNDLPSWRLLWHRLMRKEERGNIPHIIKVASEAMLMAGKWHRTRQSSGTDLLIQLPLNQFRLFDYAALDELVEIGYRTAMDRLEAWNREDWSG